VLLFGRRTNAWPRVAEVCVAGLVVIPAFLGHAGATEDLRALSVLVDVVHLAAAGGWVGTLWLLTTAALRERRDADGPTLSAALIVAFHPVAMVAVGTVFVTGLFTAWLRMGVPVGIASSSYSGLFVAKLLLVGVTGAIGAGHSKLARRRVQSVDMGSIGRSLLTEILLAVLVLVVTAVLAGTDPIG
jgi:putative copper export protein